MEVYLNIAETGIGTYGVNAGAKRYLGHDATRLSPAEAARIAAVLPLPKKREAVAPSGFTRRYGRAIVTRMGVVRRDGLDACLYREGQPRAPDGSEAPAKRVQEPKRSLEEEAPLPPIPAEVLAPEPEAEPVIEVVAEEPMPAPPEEIVEGMEPAVVAEEPPAAPPPPQP